MLILLFCMEDIMGTILDMLDITDILIPMDTILESVRLSLRPRLKLTLLSSMVDTMDTTLDMLDTMDMLDIPMLTGDKYYLSTASICHSKTTIKQSLLLLP